jgi:hypothetical protein
MWRVASGTYPYPECEKGVRLSGHRDGSGYPDHRRDVLRNDVVSARQARLHYEFNQRRTLETTVIMRKLFIISALFIGLMAASKVPAQEDRATTIGHEPIIDIPVVRCPFPEVLRFPGGTVASPVLTEFPPAVRPVIGGSIWNQTVADKAFGHTFRYPVTTPNECCVITSGELIINLKALQTALPGVNGASGNDGVNVYSGTALVVGHVPWTSGVTAGTVKTVTFPIAATFLTGGLLSFYVQDDTAVTSATLIITRCCLTKRCVDTSLDISTGSNNGTAIAIGANDPRWTVQAPSSGVTQAVAINPGATSWVLPPAGTRWISSSPTASAPGPYVYRFSFDLGKEFPNRECRLSLQYAVDNDMTMQLDNNASFATTTTLPNAFSHFNALHTANTPVGPVGPHVLTVKVTNTSGPTGLLISGRIECRCKRPAPGDVTNTQ